VFTKFLSSIPTAVIICSFLSANFVLGDDQNKLTRDDQVQVSKGISVISEAQNFGQASRPCSQKDLGDPSLDCGRRQRYVEEKVRQSKPIDEVIREISNREDVFLIAEDHESSNGPDAEMALVSSLKALYPDLDCIATEVESQYSSFFEDFSNGKIQFEGIINDMIQAQGMDKPVPYLWSREKFYEAAVKLGIKIYAVDRDQQTSLPENVFARNETIASNISKLIQMGKCHRLVGVFGKVHVAGQNKLLNKKDIPEILTSLGVKNIGLNLESENELFNSFSPQDCAWRVEAPKGNVGFETKEPSPAILPAIKAVPSVGLHDDLDPEKWSDYSATFVFN
jgi:hypothetical protein